MTFWRKPPLWRPPLSLPQRELKPSPRVEYLSLQHVVLEGLGRGLEVVYGVSLAVPARGVEGAPALLGEEP